MTLAYYDSFAGLLPCRIVAVGDWNNDGSQARIQFTTTRGGYQRGEFCTTKLRNVIPRSAVYRSRQHCGQYRIKSYSWESR